VNAELYGEADPRIARRMNPSVLVENGIFVGEIRGARWPESNRNGGRNQIGIPGSRMALPFQATTPASTDGCPIHTGSILLSYAELAHFVHHGSPEPRKDGALDDGNALNSGRPQTASRTGQIDPKQPVGSGLGSPFVC
jgi:hypothetical protein